MDPPSTPVSARRGRGRPPGAKNKPKAQLPPTPEPPPVEVEPENVFDLPGSQDNPDGAPEPEPWSNHPPPKPAREFVMELLRESQRTSAPAAAPPAKPAKRCPKREQLVDCLKEYQRQFPVLRETVIDFDGASDEDLAKHRDKFKALIDQSFSVGDILKHGYCTVIGTVEPSLVRRGIRVGGLSSHLSNSGTEAGRHVDIAFRQLAAEMKLNDVNIRPELRILGVTLFAGQQLHSQRANDAREAEEKGAKAFLEKKADLEVQRQYDDL